MEKIDLIAEYWINLYKENVISAYLALKCATFEMEYYYDNRIDFISTQDLKDLKNELIENYSSLTEEDLTHILTSCCQMEMDDYLWNVAELAIDLCIAIDDYHFQNENKPKIFS